MDCRRLLREVGHPFGRPKTDELHGQSRTRRAPPSSSERSLSGFVVTGSRERRLCPVLGRTTSEIYCGCELSGRAGATVKLLRAGVSGLASGLASTGVVLVALWIVSSSIFFGIKLGLEHSSPNAFALMRVVAAISVLGAIVLARRGRGIRREGRRVHFSGMALGATNVAGFLVMQNAGMANAQVGVAAVLIFTQPLLVAVGAALILDERLTFRQTAGLLAGWCGLAVAIIGELDEGRTRFSSVALLLGAALSWALGTLIFKCLSSEIPVWSLLLWQNIYGLIPVSVVAAIGARHADWSGPLFLAALWVGVGGSVGGFGLQMVLLRRGKASIVSSWIFAVPVIAAATGVIVFGDRLQPNLLIGGAGIAAGIYFVNSAGPSRGPLTL